jgi:hypothetical protein
MRARWTWSLGLTLAILGGVRAEELHWHSAGAAKADAPAVAAARLGQPEAAAEAASPQPVPQAPFLPLPYVARGQAPGGPVTPVPPPAPPPPPPPLPGGGLASPEEAYNCGVATTPATAHPILDGGRGFYSGVCDCVKNIFRPTDGRCLFQSDHCFDTFISPVTHPAYFLDPRCLTEVRPVFIYQRIPGSTPDFNGGNIEFFGVYASLAVTQRLSFIVSELGGIWINPSSTAAGVQRTNGFSEVHLGPQYTFIRNEQTGTLLAAGLIFEIPAGPDRVFQNTGNLSLTPYFSFGQQFGESCYGRFHFLNTTGFEFAVDGRRTDRFFSSFHLDYDIANVHHYYPLIELNYALYPTHGGERDFNFEGLDLINFGSRHVAGQNFLSIAAGGRLVFGPVSFGAAVEFPLLNEKELMRWRLTFDVIFRY